MRRIAQTIGALHWGGLLGLVVPFLLVSCASWTNPAKPSSAFADDAAACKAEAAHAALNSGQSDLDQDNAYTVYAPRDGRCGSGAWPLYHPRIREQG
jgi:hypothetical protein